VVGGELDLSSSARRARPDRTADTSSSRSASDSPARKMSPGTVPTTLTASPIGMTRRSWCLLVAEATHTR
jgi:hypothetical protein